MDVARAMPLWMAALQLTYPNKQLTYTTITAWIGQLPY